MSLSLACKEKLLIFEWPLKEEMKFLPWLEQRNEAESYYHGHGERRTKIQVISLIERERKMKEKYIVEEVGRKAFILRDPKHSLILNSRMHVSLLIYTVSARFHRGKRKAKKETDSEMKCFFFFFRETN